MDSSFNPHEILAKLRAKQNGVNPANNINISESNGFVSHNNNGSSVQMSNNNHKNNNEPIPPPNGSINSLEKSSTVKPRHLGSKVIKTPAGINLTPAQRKDNLTVRTELEKEVNRLETEVAHLRTENEQLRTDKNSIEQQFMEYKVKSEDTLVKLRGKIAMLQSQMYEHDKTGAKVNKSNSWWGTHPNNVIIHPKQLKLAKQKLIASTASTPSGSSGSHHHGMDESNEERNQTAAGFREPTFSELMRRSTARIPYFEETLRKTHQQSLYKDVKTQFIHSPIEVTSPEMIPITPILPHHPPVTPSPSYQTPTGYIAPYPIAFPNPYNYHHPMSSNGIHPLHLPYPPPSNHTHFDPNYHHYPHLPMNPHPSHEEPHPKPHDPSSSSYPHPNQSIQPNSSRQSLAFTHESNPYNPAAISPSNPVPLINLSSRNQSSRNSFASSTSSASHENRKSISNQSKNHPKGNSSNEVPSKEPSIGKGPATVPTSQSSIASKVSSTAGSKLNRNDSLSSKISNNQYVYHVNHHAGYGNHHDSNHDELEVIEIDLSHDSPHP